MSPRRPTPTAGVHAFAGTRADWHTLSTVSACGCLLFRTRCGAYVEQADLVAPGVWSLCPACQRACREDRPW